MYDLQVNLQNKILYWGDETESNMKVSQNPHKSVGFHTMITTIGNTNVIIYSNLIVGQLSFDSLRL